MLLSDANKTKEKQGSNKPARTNILEVLIPTLTIVTHAWTDFK